MSRVCGPRVTCLGRFFRRGLPVLVTHAESVGSGWPRGINCTSRPCLE